LILSYRAPRRAEPGIYERGLKTALPPPREPLLALPGFIGSGFATVSRPGMAARAMDATVFNLYK
jgi:hypothetical protein